MSEVREFVRAGMKQGHQVEFYQVDGGRILGLEEFAGLDASLFVAATKLVEGNVSQKVFFLPR